MKKYILMLMLVMTLVSNLYSEDKIGTYGDVSGGKYAAGVVLSWLIGFGVGNHIVGQRGAMITFAILDSMLLVGGSTMIVLGNIGGSKEMALGGLSAFILYSLIRFIELGITVAGPFTGVGMKKNTKQASYLNTKVNYFMKKIPKITGGKNSIGLEYSYQL